MEKSASRRETNKARHREALLEAAEKLFTGRGFDSTSIDDVAALAGLTKRTLYQYFLSKEDLFFAVALKGARLLTENYERALAAGGTALDKIRAANCVYLDFYENRSGLFKLLNYQPSNRENNQASPNYHEFERIGAVRLGHYASLVEEARRDGSINPALDAGKAVFFAFYAAFSLLFAVSGSDEEVWKTMGLDECDFLRFCFDMLSNAIK